MSLSILIPEACAKKVLARLIKLARTAGVDVAPVAGTTSIVKDDKTLTCSRYTIGELPQQSGYKFVARLQHETGGNIVAKAPGDRDGGLAGVFGIDVMFGFRTAPNKCDHCNAKRARKETFVLRDALGQYLQIGRNCLADFLAADPAQLVAIAEFAAEAQRLVSDENWDGYGSGGYWESGVLEFVTHSIASVAARGFVKTQDERGRMSTKNHANFLLGPIPSRDPARQEWIDGRPTPDQASAAIEALEWVKNLPESDTRSEYMWNLKLAAARGGVGKNEGLLASLYSAYCRAQGLEQKKSQTAEPEPPRAAYAAEAGWIWKGQAVLVRRAMVESEWGSKAICTFRSTDGFEIVWFASGASPQDLGVLYDLKGRVKKCEQYKGIHQTVIARAAWSPILAASVAA